MTSEKFDIISKAIKAREQEIFQYQINIENYKFALEEIEILPQEEQNQMIEFAVKLNQLLATELQEMNKSHVLLRALKRQIT